MDRKDFEELVKEALADIPEEFRGRLENIEVVVEDEPSARLLREMGVPRGDTLLGLYQGVPLGEREYFYGNALPDRISLYMRPILETGGSRDDIAETIRDTVIHEIGHHFGLSDETMEREE